MRLTLLTLMAYLDDVLDPSHAKEIGEKIAESPVAADLAARIKEVIRRRRIGAPDAVSDDKQFPANSVAEYLDYTLPPAQIPDVERKCLNSDDRLAEVAACHQILTLVLGEPVSVSDKTRERMYSLVDDRYAAAEAVAGRALEDVPSEPLRQVETASIERASDNQPGRFEDGIPDYLKPRPLWQRALPIGTVALVLGVWAFAIFTDTAFQQNNRKMAANDAPPANEESDVPGPPTEENDQAGKKADVLAPETSGTTDDGQSAPTNELTDGGGDPVVTPVVPPPPGTSTVAMTPPSKAVAGGNAEPGDENTEEKPEPPPVKPAVPKQPIPTIAYVSKDTLLLKRDDLRKLEGWFVVPQDETLNAGDEFASPIPFRATVSVSEQGLTVKPDGHTHFEILGNSMAAAYGFKIDSGRMVFERNASKAPDTEGKPVAFSLKAGEDLWKIEMLEDDTLLGINVRRRLPDHFEQEFDGKTHSVVVTVLRGEVRAHDGGERVELISDGSLELAGLDEGETGTFAEPRDDTLNLLGETAWITRDVYRSSQNRRREGLRFTKEFDTENPASMTMPAVFKNPDPRISELAVQTLALINKAPDLVSALATATHEEARQAAITGLREWLPTNQDNRGELKAELEKVFQPETAEIVYSLLWGYNIEDGKDEAISRQLVSWLRHEHVAVRELAIFHIERLTGRTYDYRPLAPVNQRDSIAARWDQHVDREGALVK